VDENKVYSLIESERRERISAIEGIHTRLDDLFALVNKLNKPNNANASWTRQSIGLTIAVIALIGFLVPTMVAIVRPMQQQIDYVRDYSRDSTEKMDEKLQIEIMKQSEAGKLENERGKARLSKLEEWQKWMYREVVPVQGDLKGRIQALEQEIVRMNELFKIRDENIKKLSE